MNYQEIIEKLGELEINPSELAYNDLDKEVFGEVEVIHEVGDCEGGGDYSEKVFFFKDHNVYVQITGYYASYNGTEWDDEFTEVFPKQKTITVYEGV